MQYKLYVFRLLLTLLVAWPLSVSADKSARVLIVANKQDIPYQQTIKSFQENLATNTKVVYTKLYLSNIRQRLATVAETIKVFKPNLIFALGGASTQLVTQNTSTIPIVSTLVISKKIFEQANNITGVSLDYPIATRIQWLKKFFPNKSKVAILFNPQENEQTIKIVQKITQQVGLELIAIPVASPKQLPFALERLAKNVEILMAIPDRVVMSSKTAKALLLASFRNKVPFIGLSDNWVKSGALFALSWTYRDLGQQCAEQSNKLLKGTTIQNIPMEYINTVAFSINTKTANHMNIVIDNALLTQAKMIFK